MFSIVIPLYNKEEYIARTIESVLSQTLQDFEIIIVDDGSTDKSVFELKKFDDKRIKIVSQKNAGVSIARNRGIEETKYETIAFLDADDEWLPNHLQELMDLKNNFPECKVFATGYKIVDSEGYARIPVKSSVFGISENSGIILNYFDAAIKTAPPLWISAIAVNKIAINEVGGFPDGVTTGEDLLTWARLACRYQIAYSKTITANYHFMSPDEWLRTARKQDKEDVVGKELVMLLETCQENTIDLKRYIGLWHRMRLHNFMKMGDRAQAFKELCILLKYNKKDYKSYVLFLLTLLPVPLRRYILSKRAQFMSIER